MCFERKTWQASWNHLSLILIFLFLYLPIFVFLFLIPFLLLFLLLVWCDIRVCMRRLSANTAWGFCQMQLVDLLGNAANHVSSLCCIRAPSFLSKHCCNFRIFRVLPQLSRATGKESFIPLYCCNLVCTPIFWLFLHCITGCCRILCCSPCFCFRLMFFCWNLSLLCWWELFCLFLFWLFFVRVSRKNRFWKHRF